MRPGPKAGAGSGGENTLIEHMKASVQPSGAAVPSTSSPTGTAGVAAGLRSGYASLGSGAAVPPTNSGAAVGSSTSSPASTTTAAQQTRENIERALRMNEATNNSGYATLQSLGKQREVIQNSLNTVDSTQRHLGDSRQVIREIRMGVYKEWIIKGSVIAFLVLLIILIIYSKFIR